MSDDAVLDDRLRAADPLGPDSLPSAADTEAALHRFLADGPRSTQSRRGFGLRGRMARPRLLAGTTAGAAAVGTTLAVLLSGTATAPAFAVTRNANGTVTVRLIRVSGIDGANHRLALMGVRAEIVTSAPVGALRMARIVATLHPCQGPGRSESRTVTFDPASIPRQQVLMLAADRAAHLGYYSAAAKLRRARTGQIPLPDAGNTSSSGTGNSGPGNTGTGNSGGGQTVEVSCGTTGNTGTPPPPPGPSTGNS